MTKKPDKLHKSYLFLEALIRIFAEYADGRVFRDRERQAPISLLDKQIMANMLYNVLETVTTDARTTGFNGYDRPVFVVGCHLLSERGELKPPYRDGKQLLFLSAKGLRALKRRRKAQGGEFVFSHVGNNVHLGHIIDGPRKFVGNPDFEFDVVVEPRPSSMDVVTAIRKRADALGQGEVEFSLEYEDQETFIVVESLRIAKRRGRLGKPGGTWTVLEPGWTVDGTDTVNISYADSNKKEDRSGR